MFKYSMTESSQCRNISSNG